MSNTWNIDDFDAATIANSWHSVMTWNDPGVAMYSVASTGKVHSEEHRARLITYIDGCIGEAASLDEQGDAPTLPEQFSSNVEELEALKEWADNFEIGVEEFTTP